MLRNHSASHSPARNTSPWCSGKVDTLGMGKQVDQFVQRFGMAILGIRDRIVELRHGSLLQNNQAR
jgi:hypothetical protein